MRRTTFILFSLAACGGDDAAVQPDAPGGDPDSMEQVCQPLGAVGTFYRRPPNPKIIAGTHQFADNKLDTAIADPDLLWDGTTWHLYYQSPHGTSFTNAGPMVIRHATSANLSTWTFDEAPSLTVSASGWDSTHTETPSVAFNPNAPADKRFVMVYSGASGTFPNYTFADYSIGVAFSPDGRVFTRGGNAGQALTGAQVYPGSADAIVADPEIVFVNGTYHLWFSSFACNGANCATVDANGIAHATSADAVTWTIGQAPVTSLLRMSSMPSTGYSQPSVIYDDIHCRWELWMADQSNVSSQPVKLNNMSAVLHAKSNDGISWSKDAAADLTWDSTAGGEDLGLRRGADIAAKSTGRYMVYVGFDDDNVPTGSRLPTGPSTSVDGVFTLNVATRDGQL